MLKECHYLAFFASLVVAVSAFFFSFGSRLILRVKVPDVCFFILIFRGIICLYRKFRRIQTVCAPLFIRNIVGRVIREIQVLEGFYIGVYQFWIQREQIFSIPLK